MDALFFFSQFDILASRKQLSGKSLAKEAKCYWTFQTLKGRKECPFPELLIKYHLGDYDRCE